MSTNKDKQAVKNRKDLSDAGTSWIESGVNMKPTHEDMDWYHGLLPRADINKLLENDGDFLVRTTHKDKDGLTIILSVKWNGKCHHYPCVELPDGTILVDDKRFDSVLDMITSLKTKKTPVSKEVGAILINPIMKQEWELRHDQISLGKMLGEGAFGGVYRATMYHKGRKIPVAVKVSKGNTKMSTKSMIEEVCKEARIMRKYQHPNIVNFYGVCVEREPIMLVMELANMGALDSYLQNEKNNVTLRDKMRFSLDAAKGLEYLHQHGCIHRDVAARNFLVHKCSVKISDFGLSKQLSDHAHKYKLKDLHQKLPIRWLAPEVMASATYTFKSDVFSFGILLWEIFMDGAIPYPGMTLAEVSREVRKGYRMEPPDRMPTFVRTVMINQCFPNNPEDRGNMTEIRNAIENMLEGRISAFQNMRSVYYRT
ncbi:unnamed protein product [Caenorhabditis bovis]|uniref:Tyrosine-protein kinase n=1 Tax=Caenorhabditis bovis TaxID=2654633 RepID=A0A8S1EC75_9PELO|nr:unnamed protein product [Caenorhabditis bovis]